MVNVFTRNHRGRMSFPIDDDGIERFRIGNKTLVLQITQH
ncbi:Uncharacterised protein [Vibrio cholerae]|nr:Uncharacterised protein [Vibrio cholerae]CSC28819.1 Uncharacterised protein [Vibrio cholerae]